MNREKLGDYILENKCRVKHQNIPVFSITNDQGFVTSEEKFSKKVYSKDVSNYKVVNNNCLAYNPSRINVGSIALNKIGQACAVSPMYTVFECNTKALLPKYLLFFLRSLGGLEAIKQKTLGTVRFQLKFDQLKNISMPLPSIAEQNKIVSTLEEIDELRQKQSNALELAKQMIPALFYDMFGDPAVNNLHWDFIPLQEALESIVYGCSKKASEESTGLPIIRMNNVNYEGTLELNDLKYVNLDEKEIRKFSLKKGDVLFNRTNSRELVGKTAVWDKDTPAIFASYFIRLQLNQTVLSPFYFSTYMNLPFMKQYLKGLARGAIGQANINAKELSSIQIMTPPINKQEEFIQRLRDASSLKVEQEKSLQKLDALFDSTLNQVFSSKE